MKRTFARRGVVHTMAAAGVVALPVARLLSPGAAHADARLAYDPNAQFDLDVNEVELRRNSAGRMLMARIYQPKGPGPFPTVLDLHGGAWNGKNRFAELQEVNKAINSAWRLFHQWRRDQVSLDEMVAAVHRQRLHLIPNESVPTSVSASN